MNDRVGEQGRMLGNRIKKTLRKLKPKMERESIGAFRLYDRDIPEIRAVVDWYEGHVVIAEYARKQTPAGWIETMAEAIGETLGLGKDHVHVKSRKAVQGARYEKLSTTGERLQVRERDLRFWVNLHDYIDTGLFAHHRDTRARFRAEAKGKRVLNLFGYTGAFTCYAAVGGAASTTTVDASGTYLGWTQDNLRLNKLGDQEIIKADAERFLNNETRKWDLCILDPPSFSTRFGDGKLDIQRDHEDLIGASLRRLDRGGVLYFSTNHQRFEPHFDAEEIDTIPEDFRNRRVHRCWRLVR